MSILNFRQKIQEEEEEKANLIRMAYVTTERYREEQDAQREVKRLRVQKILTDQETDIIRK
jgi:hypothetical protein